MRENTGQSVVIPSHVRHVEDDLKHVVVMNTQNGEIFGLDRSAAVIWNALAGSGSEAAAVVALIGRYQITQEHAVREVHGFVDKLVAAKLLTLGGTE